MLFCFCDCCLLFTCLQNCTKEEHDTVDHIIDNHSIEAGKLDFDILRNLYRRGLIYFNIPIGDNDYIVGELVSLLHFSQQHHTQFKLYYPHFNFFSLYYFNFHFFSLYYTDFKFFNPYYSNLPFLQPVLFQLPFFQPVLFKFPLFQPVLFQLPFLQPVLFQNPLLRPVPISPSSLPPFTAVPTLQGFVMNRVQGDYLENLLYKIFVSLDERTNMAEVSLVRWKASVKQRAEDSCVKLQC